MDSHLVLGGPGAGKTTRLLSIMEAEIARGVSPMSIAFVSFTRKAATEAKERVEKKFGLKDLPYFRTLHSLATRELHLRSSMMMSSEHYRELSQLLGINVTGKQISESDLELQNNEGDRMLFIYGYAAVRKISLAEAYQQIGTGIDWHILKLVGATIDKYKADLGVWDFNDILGLYVQNCSALPVDVAIIDEAQDLSPLQWDMVNHAMSKVKRIYYAGDDDQAIYSWAGADVKYFLNLPVDRTEVLPVSYRLPQSIFDLANGISSRIGQRFHKDWTCRDEPGTVDRVMKAAHVDFRGNWLVLARNLRGLKEAEAAVKIQGLPFNSRWGASVKPDHLALILLWQDALKTCKMSNKDFKRLQESTDYPLHFAPFPGEEQKFTKVSCQGLWYDALTRIPIRDRQYYQAILSRGYKLTDEPQITIDTIHASKGGEADNVFLVRDMSTKPYDAMMKRGAFADDEHRVFYVGATRARHRLVLQQPQTKRSYDL